MSYLALALSIFRTEPIHMADKEIIGTHVGKNPKVTRLTKIPKVKGETFSVTEKAPIKSIPACRMEQRLQSIRSQCDAKSASVHRSSPR